MKDSGGLQRSPVQEILRQHKSGRAVGMYSICSAHPFVLQACMRQAINGRGPLLIEATSNQVNQFGGYTAMNPARFSAFVEEIAAKMDFPLHRIMLGGDHLGPNAWQAENASAAMHKARQMIRDYVSAGFEKIHLDASMRCLGDPGDSNAALPDELIARRTADLCYAAEEAHRAGGVVGQAPVYVIGTEVPVPGGAREAEGSLSVTKAEAAKRAIEITREAFYERGLQAAWERVVATVVQPGVEFGDEVVFDYQSARAAELRRMIEGYDGLVFEAHSTDYQREAALRELVRDHFAILKVGPALAFAFREAVFALEMMEMEWLAGRRDTSLSSLRDAIDKAMLQAPVYWRRHYHGGQEQVRFARKYSYSDRVRYYWTYPAVQNALQRLIENLSVHRVPLTLVSQFMPRQYDAIRDGEIANHPLDLIYHRINEVTTAYAGACGSM